LNNTKTGTARGGGASVSERFAGGKGSRELRAVTQREAQ